MMQLRFNGLEKSKFCLFTSLSPLDSVPQTANGFLDMQPDLAIMEQP
jgi:hypothetical protein